MDSCDILIDANIALHFPRIDQLDWPGLTGCRTCTIAIAPILLRELEQKKIFGATSSPCCFRISASHAQISHSVTAG